MKPAAGKPFAKTMDSQLGETKKPQQRSLQDGHQEILRNLQSTIIGKPTIVEAQRILKVMDAVIQQLEMCSYLDAEFVGRFFSGKFQKDLIQNLTEETQVLLQHQAEIEQRYRPYANMDQLIKEGEELDEARKQESERLENLLKENFKNLLRRLSHNEGDFRIIKGLKANINNELSDLVHCVKCLRVVMLKKLSTAQEEQQNHIKQLEELKQKIGQFEKNKTQLEQELQKLRQDRSQNMSKMKEEIEKLKNSINEVKQNKQKRQDNLAKDIQSKYDGLEKEHKTKEEKLMAELQTLKSKFVKMKDENAGEEAQLKRRKHAQDQLLVDAIQNYDLMMEEKMQQLTDLKNECQTIAKQLKDKQEYFAAVDGERARERELEEEFRKIRENHRIEQDKRQEAARHIQAFLQQVKKPSKKGGKKAKK